MGYFQKFLDPSFHNLPLKPSTRQNLLCASYETRCLVKFHPRNSLIYNNSAQTALLHANKDTNSNIRTSKKKWYSIRIRTCTFSANASISTSLDFVTKELNQFVLRLVLSMRSTLDSTCLSVQVLVERIELVSLSRLCQTYYEETFSVQSIMWTTSTTKAVQVRGSKNVLVKIGIASLWKRDACCVCV